MSDKTITDKLDEHSRKWLPFKRATPAQKAARERNWNRLRVLGAASICNIRTSIGSPEDDADLAIAQEALRRIARRHQEKVRAHTAAEEGETP